MWFGGGSAVLADWAEEVAGAGSFFLTVFLYFAGFSLAYLVATLPLAFYGEYVLEHQFGLSTQTLGRWAGRRLKKWLLSFAIAVPLVLLVYWLLRACGRWWWIPAWAAWIFVGYVLTKFAPRLLVPLFFRMEIIADTALADRLRGLASRAGIELSGAYRIDLSRETRKANAAVLGFGSTRRVVLGDTLLSAFSPDEIAVVFAHELGHIVGRHLLKGFVWAAGLSAASLYVGSLVLERAAAALGVRVHDVETLPVLVAVVAGIQFLVRPFEKWFSRRRERASDAYALRTTGDREAFVSAMKKLGAMNLADVSPNKLAEILLFDHPPILKRIRFAKKFDLAEVR